MKLKQLLIIGSLLFSLPIITTSVAFGANTTPQEETFEEKRRRLEEEKANICEEAYPHPDNRLRKVKIPENGSYSATFSLSLPQYNTGGETQEFMFRVVNRTTNAVRFFRSRNKGVVKARLEKENIDTTNLEIKNISKYFEAGSELKLLSKCGTLGDKDSTSIKRKGSHLNISLPNNAQVLFDTQSTTNPFFIITDEETSLADFEEQFLGFNILPQDTTTLKNVTADFTQEGELVARKVIKTFTSTGDLDAINHLCSYSCGVQDKFALDASKYDIVLCAGKYYQIPKGANPQEIFKYNFTPEEIEAIEIKTDEVATKFSPQGYNKNPQLQSQGAGCDSIDVTIDKNTHQVMFGDVVLSKLPTDTVMIEENGKFKLCHKDHAERILNGEKDKASKCTNYKKTQFDVSDKFDAVTGTLKPEFRAPEITDQVTPAQQTNGQNGTGTSRTTSPAIGCVLNTLDNSSNKQQPKKPESDKITFAQKHKTKIIFATAGLGAGITLKLAHKAYACYLAEAALHNKPVTAQGFIKYLKKHKNKGYAILAAALTTAAGTFAVHKGIRA